MIINTNNINFKKKTFFTLGFVSDRESNYKLHISDKNLDEISSTLILDLPKYCEQTFYKGYDEVLCEYTDGKYRYEFEASILRISYGKEPYVIIQLPNQVKQSLCDSSMMLSYETEISFAIINSTFDFNGDDALQGIGKTKIFSSLELSFISNRQIPIDTELQVDFFRFNFPINLKIRKKYLFSDFFYYECTISNMEQIGKDKYSRFLSFLKSKGC